MASHPLSGPGVDPEAGCLGGGEGLGGRGECRSSLEALVAGVLIQGLLEPLEGDALVVEVVHVRLSLFFLHPLSTLVSIG